MMARPWRELIGEEAVSFLLVGAADFRRGISSSTICILGADPRDGCAAAYEGGADLGHGGDAAKTTRHRRLRRSVAEEKAVGLN